MGFTGTYRVVSSPDFDTGYPHLTETPHVTLRQNENGSIRGEYEIGVQCGTPNGHACGDFVDFDFDGNDEMEEVFGEGEATLDGDLLTFELRYHHGDEYVFHCERQR